MKSRQIKDSWIAHAPPVVREVWDYLIREANHCDRKYNGLTIKRGQLFRSFKEIREDLSWNIGYRKKTYSENQMKHCMKVLRRYHMIDLTNQPRGNLITVCNYDFYQNPKNYESTNESTDESTNNQPTINQWPTAINKNVKKDKNYNYNPDLKKSVSFEATYRDFIEMFNEAAGTYRRGGKPGKFKGDEKSKRQFKKLIALKYKFPEDFRLAARNMFQSQHHIDSNYIYATPELLTRPEKFEMFLNIKENERPKSTYRSPIMGMAIPGME